MKKTVAAEKNLLQVAAGAKDGKVKLTFGAVVGTVRGEHALDPCECCEEQ